MNKLKALKVATLILEEHYEGLTPEVLDDRLTSDDGRLCTVREVAELLQIDDTTVRNLVRTGKIECLKVNRTDLRIPRAEVRRYVERVRNKDSSA